jgi:hypothetical protein
MQIVVGAVPGQEAITRDNVTLKVDVRRLSYANASIAEAVIVAGWKLGNDTVLRNGPRMLEWLLAGETRNGHLSVVPARGWGPGEKRPGFDQQPIEVAALADACVRAVEVTGELTR